MNYSAAVFAIRNQLLVCASPMTEAGISTVGQVLALADGVDDATLGAAVQKAMMACVATRTRPTADDYEGLLVETGSTSLKDFFRSAVMVAVDEDGKGGLFVRRVEKPDRGNSVRFSAADDPFGAASQLAVGAAVRRMLKAALPR